MVVNLCLPHFCTTAKCNKLCADGYDVTNLVSADPALRRRGFKLEYFLRPPVQVTLTFGFQVELWRVDVELWPWGMDLGQSCKRLEISTCSDRLPSQHSGQGHQQVQPKEQRQIPVKEQDVQDRGKQQAPDRNSWRSKGHQWSRQAKQCGEQAPDESQHKGHALKSHSNTESSSHEPDFKLVGRCELREDTKVCFTRSNFSPRPPFLSPLPPQPANCGQEDLWSRGLLSLGAVTQLRVTVPFGGAASAQGLKMLVVWGQPARCCPAEEVERIRRVHEASERRLPQPGVFAPSVSQKKTPLQGTSSLSNLSAVPEDFLDPITAEVMLLPMLLPSGVSVDHSTLEEHQKREATWGRTPNDPFTGVPFTSTSKPLPNPPLKSRIDHFVLQRGMMRRDGMLGGQGEADNPQASRLVSLRVEGRSHNSPCRDSKSELEGRKKRGISKESAEGLTAGEQLLPQTKRPRNDAVSAPSCSSHEERLSASLDEALFSALQGRPSFTSNLSQPRQVIPDSEPLSTSQPCQTAGPPSTSTGEKTCSACSCSVSVYSKCSIYRLTCDHLLCRSCLRGESQPLNTDTIVNKTSNPILCPACQSTTARSDIIRVHH